MKRLHIINLEKMGGAEKMFLQYISARENQQDIIVSIGDFIDEEILSHLNGKSIIYPNRIFNNSKIKYPPLLRKISLLKKVEYHRPNVVIVWDIVIRLPRKIRNCLTIHYDHGSSWRFISNDKTHKYFSMVDAAIVVSHAAKYVLQQRFGLTEIKVIPNTLPQPENLTLKKDSPSKEKLVLGTASRLVALKGIGVSILTVRELIDRGYNATLLIAGKGPNQADLETLVSKLGISDKVIFLGHQTDLSSFYAKIGYYMSTPLTESFGLSCMAAIQHGVPCIYPVIDGQPEIIEHNVTGWGIIPDLSPESFKNQAGYDAEVPYQIYDPINQCLTDAKLINYQTCADVIEESLINDNYRNIIENIFTKNKSHVPSDFITDIEDFVNGLDIK